MTSFLVSRFCKSIYGTLSAGSKKLICATATRYARTVRRSNVRAIIRTRLRIVFYCRFTLWRLHCYVYSIGCQRVSSKEIASRKCAHVFERDPPFSRTEYNITTFQNVFANIPRSSGVALRFTVLRALSTRKTSIRVSRVSAYCHPHIRAPHPDLSLPSSPPFCLASIRIVPNALFLTS